VIGSSTDSLPGIVYATPAATAGYSSIASQTLTRTGGRSSGGPQMARYIATIDEMFTRQLALQWWGNTVGSATLHDDWLSSGLANFSASLYDVASKSGEFNEHWVEARRAILDRNRFGIRPNDAGPIWMGMLNDGFKTGGVGRSLATFKGGYVLHMLR